MRTVFSNSELARVWASRSQSEGRGSHMFFRDSTIFSYGSHFVIASFIRNRKKQVAVAFTDRDYSVSTSKHKLHVRRALYSSPFPVFTGDVDVLNRAADGSKFAQGEAFGMYAGKLARLRDREKCARKHKAFFQEQSAELIAEANRFAEFCGADWRLA